MKKAQLLILSRSYKFPEAATISFAYPRTHGVLLQDQGSHDHHHHHGITGALISPFPTHSTSPPLCTWLCRFLKQKWKASWVLKVILLNIKLHHMHTFILKYFTTFEALEAPCLALPSSCFLPVCNPWVCFVTREGFSDTFVRKTFLSSF